MPLGAAALKRIDSNGCQAKAPGRSS